MSDLFVARTSGTVQLGGRRHAIRRGVTVAQEGSDMLTVHRRLFEPMRVHYPAPERARRGRQAPVEQATAAPGERRTVAVPDPAPAGDGPQRPPTSGPGSGAQAWREYAAAVTGAPVDSYAALGRDEIIALLESEGVGR